MKDGEDYTVGSGHNLGVLVGYSDGAVELCDIYGEVLYRYDSGHNAGVQYLVSTIQGDGNCYSELKFLTLAQDKILRIHSIDMWLVKQPIFSPKLFGLQSPRANISISLDTTATLFTNSPLSAVTKQPMDGNVLYTDSETRATAVIFYVRGGVRYWVIGDSKGGISLHHYNGTFIRRDETGKGPIVALDRFGPMAVFAGGQAVGTYNLQLMQIQLMCEEVSSRQQSAHVTDILIDSTSNSNIVTAAYDNGEILVFDTKSVVDDKYVCKTLTRMHLKGSNPPFKLSSFRNGVLIWSSDGVLSYLNLAQISSQTALQVSHKELASSSAPLILKTCKMPSGSYFLAVATSPFRLSFSECLPSPKPVSASMDFGNLKVIL
jgi:hypothetical protein